MEHSTLIVTLHLHRLVQLIASRCNAKIQPGANTEQALILCDITTKVLLKCCTEWFKINLTLFKIHVSHKWDSTMNLFEYIYKA